MRVLRNTGAVEGNHRSGATEVRKEPQKCKVRKYKMRKNVELRGMINQYKPIKLLRTQKMHGTLYENTININNLSKFIIGQIMA